MGSCGRVLVGFVRVPAEKVKTFLEFIVGLRDKKRLSTSLSLFLSEKNFDFRGGERT